MLAWPGDANATGYTVRRKLRDEVEWGAPSLLSANTLSYTDSNVVVGGSYEYAVYKSAAAYGGEGFIYAGIQSPLVEARGKVVLLVDNTFTSSLALELAQLQQDMTGDGWTVLRHDVPRMSVSPSNTSSTVWTARASELASIKALILADYTTDPSNVKAVFLLGHVPVPYAGKIAPDGHGDHLGAWPADMFYGDMVGAWTDTLWNTTTASDRRNWNAVGDGKFDQPLLPGVVDLQVGRVDFANLPAIPRSETELMRQYLRKAHSFRHRLFTAVQRGLINDHFGLATGEALAANGWRNFAPLFGASNCFASSDWFSALKSQSYLWGYSCGGGTFTSAAGMGNISQYATNDPRVVFTMVYGSYFGDWDSPNNFLRAQLSSPSYTLTCAWAGRPNWQFHHMALGETVGFSTRLSQNNDGSLYGVNSDGRSVHIALLGDPTLRMHVVAPPAALTVATNGVGGVTLSWSSAPDTVLGYHVYRATTAAGPFTRLNPDLIVGTAFTDPEITTNVYMVRAVKLEVSASGSYYNASQGIFQSLDGTAGAPRIALLQPTNGTVFLAPTNLTLAATTFDPANCITNVAFYANGLLVGQAAGIAQTAVWTNAPAGTYSVVAQTKCQHGQVTNSSPAQIMIVGNSPTLTISAIGNGVQGRGDGMPGRVYRIQYLHTLAATNWQTLLTTTSSLAGIFQFTDTGSSTQKFYRAVFP